MSTCWSRKRSSHLLSCTDIIINVGSRCENISTTNWISLNSSSPAEDPIPNHLNKPIPLFWPVTWSFPTISRYDLSMKLVWNVENRHLFTSFRLFRTFFFFFFFFYTVISSWRFGLILTWWPHVIVDTICWIFEYEKCSFIALPRSQAAAETGEADGAAPFDFLSGTKSMATQLHLFIKTQTIFFQLQALIISLL